MSRSNHQPINEPTRQPKETSHPRLMTLFLRIRIRIRKCTRGARSSCGTRSAGRNGRKQYRKWRFLRGAVPTPPTPPMAHRIHPRGCSPLPLLIPACVRVCVCVCVCICVSTFPVSLPPGCAGCRWSGRLCVPVEGKRGGLVEFTRTDGFRYFNFLQSKCKRSVKYKCFGNWNIPLSTFAFPAYFSLKIILLKMELVKRLLSLKLLFTKWKTINNFRNPEHIDLSFNCWKLQIKSKWLVSSVKY